MEAENRGRHGVIKNFLYQGSATLSTYLVSLALIPLVLKNAGASVYGSFVIWSSLINLGIAVFTLGAGFKARRQLPSLERLEDKQRVFLRSASFQVLTYSFAAVALVLLGKIAQYYFVRTGQSPAPLSIVAVVASVYLNTLSDDYFRYTHRIKITSFVSVLRSLGYPTLVGIHVLLGGNLTVSSLLYCQAASYGICSLWLWLKIAREFQIKFRLAERAYHLEDIRYGFPLTAAVLVENLLAVSDRYILGIYLSATAVGIYSSAASVGSLILIFPKIASSVLVPAMAGAIDSGDKHEAESMLHNTLKVFLALAFPFILGAAFLGQPILALLANPAVGVAGRRVVPLIAIATLLYGWNYITFNALFVKMETGLWLRANALAAALSMTLNLVILYFFRHIEIAAVTAITAYGCALLFVHRSHSRSWPVRLDYPFLMRISIGVAGMSAVLFLGIRILGGAHSPFVIITILVPVGVLTYGVVLTVVGVLGKSEFSLLKRCLHR